MAEKQNQRGIEYLIEEFRNGGRGEGAILLHKRLHGNGSGKAACARGLLCGCENVINCQHLYCDKTGVYCTLDGQNAIGCILVEEKHRDLVERNAPGAYSSIEELFSGLSNQKSLKIW